MRAGFDPGGIRKRMPFSASKRSAGAFAALHQPLRGCRPEIAEAISGNRVKTPGGIHKE